MRRRPTVTVSILAEDGEVLHEETRRAFNAGIRASEAAMRRLAIERHTLCDGMPPTREGPRGVVGDTYLREWVAVDGQRFLARVEVTAIP